MKVTLAIVLLVLSFTAPRAQLTATGVGASAGNSGGGGGCTNGGTDLSTTCGVLTFSAIGVL